MIERVTAIPLSCYPWSSTSRIVHWFTREQGKISTLLKGALRPKSPFLGEYQLFGTSELLYYPKRTGSLYLGKECALLIPRNDFRNRWRAALTASYLTALIERSTPDHAPQAELFELLEELLDLTLEFGHQISFLYWAELHLLRELGHAPHFSNCIRCQATEPLGFSAAEGGTICPSCAQTHSLITQESPPQLLHILRHLASCPPNQLQQIQMTPTERLQTNQLSARFIEEQLNIPAKIRLSAAS
jgi:DNA repair protein RecO